MSHSGIDIICDSNDKDDLCLRYHALVAWFPLARHVYTDKKTAPYSLSNREAIKNIMGDRMQYLRLFYTCLQEVNDVGGSCLQPLEHLYDIPESKVNDEYLDQTFMVARALKITPMLKNY